jgi:glycosyltransferase involved in cell wall biosynthesis
MDLGLVASKWSETIARAALEIMSCGAPLVGARVGVMPDLLDGEALTAPGDVDAMAAMIRRAATDGDFRERLGERQSERMRELGARDFLLKTLSLYRSI